MPLSPEEVSAFAVYSGHVGNMSKKKRRRKNKMEKKIIGTTVSSESGNPLLTPTEGNIKKRKTEIGIIKGIQKHKKQKLIDSGSESLKQVLPKVHNTDTSKQHPEKKHQKLKNRPKMLSTALPNGQLLEPSKAFVNVKPKKVKNNAKKALLKKRNRSKESKIGIPQELELLTEEQVKQKINKNVPGNTKEMKFKNRKRTNNISTTVSQNESQNVEHELQSQIEVPVSVTELVGKACVNQENRPTLISKINNLKKKMAAEKICKSTKPVHEKILHQRNRLSEKLKSSEDVGKELFEKIISPCDATLFFKKHWEKSPLYIPGNSKKFSSLMSTQLIDDFLRQKVVMFGKHIDITSYNDGKRETHNPEGRALPHVVWDLYNHKCSVRLLCPQAAFSNVFVMNTKLQEYFGCFVGANAYLTPPNSQGFAPHYDDIEAFVLQIEGQKNWKIYNPRNKFETLPQYSSKNFTPSEVGKPILEVTLKPGDLLYFPRGFIHQADAGSLHSLHLTVSVYQKNCWVDLLEKALPLALSKAAKEEVDLRRGLPLNYLKRAGLAYHSPTLRKGLVKSLKEKLMLLLKHIDIDSAVDMMGVQYVTDALPPVLTPEEASRSTFGNGLRMESNGQVKGNVAFTGDTKVRFTTALCHRLIKENVKSEDGKVEEEIRLYYTTDNSREYHGEEPQFLVIPEDYVPAIKMLSDNYPLFTAVNSLPLPSLDEQATLVGDLWDRGILLTEEPLEEQEELIDADDEVLCGANDMVEDMVDLGNSSATSSRVNFIENIICNNTEGEGEIDNENEEEQEYEEEEEQEEDDNLSGLEASDNDISHREYDKAVNDLETFVSANEIEEDEDSEASSSDNQTSSEHSNNSDGNEEVVSISDNEFDSGLDAP